MTRATNNSAAIPNLKVLRFHDLLHEATSRLAKIFSTTRIDGNHGTSGDEYQLDAS